MKATPRTLGLRRRHHNANGMPIFQAYMEMTELAMALERAFNAAAKFITCHAADPDLTDEMVDAYEEFQLLRDALPPDYEKNAAPQVPGVREAPGNARPIPSSPADAAPDA